MKTFKIFEVDLIREKIVNKLSNADASNLMTALRPTKCWENFFHDKCRKTKNIYCPLCILNMKINPIENLRPPRIIRDDINSLEYPHPYILQSDVFEIDNPEYFHESKIVFTESANFKTHHFRWGITPNTLVDKKELYFQQVMFGTIPKFTNEAALVNHIKEVGKSYFKII